MDSKDYEQSIYCDFDDGPVFGNRYGSMIHISFQCIKEKGCWIDFDKKNGYEYHPEYRSSLFVNTAGSYYTNYFSVADYEVYHVNNYYNDDDCDFSFAYMLRQLIMERDGSKTSKKKVDDREALFHKLMLVDSILKLKESKKSQDYMKNPSEFLPNTQIVDSQYDSYLKEWLGDVKDMRLIYRASEHEFTTKSFHEYCDDQGPTLIVIKSSEGWIFGGYTTQSWGGYGI